MRDRFLPERRTSVCNHAARTYIRKLEESSSFELWRRVAINSHSEMEIGHEGHEDEKVDWNYTLELVWIEHLYST